MLDRARLHRPCKASNQCYDKALEVDDLAEEFYLHLIACYQRLGLQAKALSVYTRCRFLLDARLGIEPSAKTRALTVVLVIFVVMVVEAPAAPQLIRHEGT